MKKIINNPEDVVMEMCRGIAVAHPELELNQKYKIISRRRKNINKVSLISGGGSGHEPAHAGFVGEGLLDAAVCGDVFASPSQIQVYQAIRESAGDKGTLLIIKNYSGDIMNFKNAAFLAQEDGINVDYVVVDDDVAVNDSLYTVGRRGVAGTFFVHKISGAAAEDGKTLSEVKDIAEKVISNVKSLGFALSSCTVPAKGSPTFSLLEDEIEFGVGIHGEPGIKREKLATSDTLAKRIVDQLAGELNLSENDEVAVLINGFGSTPLQELYVLNYSIQCLLSEMNLKVLKIFVGNYMTSIDMEGASISILKLDDVMKQYLFSPCNAPGFKILDAFEADSTGLSELNKSQDRAKGKYSIETSSDFAVISGGKISLNNIIYMVDCISECIIKNEVAFCELDSHAGDGDFGMSVSKGFRQLKNEWHEILNEEAVSIGSFLNASALIIMEYCGGASGPIWGSAFRAAGKFAGDKTEMDIRIFSQMMAAAVAGIQKTGERSFGRGAVVGDKTLIDALVPAVDSLAVSAENKMNLEPALKKFAEQAVEGAEKTEKITARMGRAGTAGERSLGYPDAGAHALGVIFTYVYDHLEFV